MKLPNIKLPVGVTKAFGKAKLFTTAHSPEILIGVGVTSMIGGTVVACKATLKAKAVLEEKDGFIESRALIKRAKEECTEEEYSKQDYVTDLVGTYGRAAMSMAKLYLPAAVLIGLGIAAVFASNNIMRKRCASLSAAYVAVDTAFKAYRKRVVEKYGSDIDRELRYGIKKSEVEVKEIDPKTGKETIVKKQVDNFELGDYSPYARFFDDSCAPFQKDSYGRPLTDYNLFFLRAREKEANLLLRTQGFLFLNDVYKMLGIEPSIAGQTVGWLHTYDEDEVTEGDNCISFGIYKTTRANARFIEGIEDVILLDFNVDGPILDKLQGKLFTV